MTYYRKQRMESFKKAMFASRFSGKNQKTSLPQPGGLDRLMAAPRPLAS